MAKAVAPEAPMRPQYIFLDKPTGISRRPTSQAIVELEATCSISISVLKATVLSNYVHGAERGPSTHSGGFEHLALGPYAIEQIVPGLGERGTPFIEQLCGYAVRVDTGLGKFGQHITGI